MRMSAAVTDTAGAEVGVGPQTRGRGFVHVVDADRAVLLARRHDRPLSLTKGARHHG